MVYTMRIEKKILRNSLIIVALCILLFLPSSPALYTIHTAPEKKFCQTTKPIIHQDNKNNIAVRITESDTKGIILEMTLNKNSLEIEERNINNTVFDIINITGNNDFTMDPGKPCIPVYRNLVAIPSDVKISLRILESNYTSYILEHSIYPFPRTVIKQKPDGTYDVEEKFYIDTDFYSTNMFYPQMLAEIGNISKIRNLSVVPIEIHPLQYNPVAMELQVYHLLKIKLEYDHFPTQDIEKYFKLPCPL